MKEIIKTTAAPAAIGPYSQAICVSTTKLVFSAGQLGMDPQTGKMTSETIQGQTEQALKNVQAVLQAAGTDLQHVIKTTVFLKDMNDFVEMNSIYANFFNDSPPARSAVQAARLPKDALVEIEVIAAVPE